MPSVEDAELALRLSAAGVGIRLGPEIQVCHAKPWTLLSMASTDIVQRAWPWSQLILGLASVPDDLNLRWEQRTEALCAWVVVAFTVAAVRTPVALLGAVAAAAAVAFWLRRLLGCLARVKGAGFAARAFPLHLLFLLYSSATFAAASSAGFFAANSAASSIGFFTASPIGPWCEKDSPLVVKGIRTNR